MDPLWSETCWGTFKYFVILIVPTYILCISWELKCFIIVDTRCTHEKYYVQCYTATKLSIYFRRYERLSHTSSLSFLTSFYPRKSAWGWRDGFSKHLGVKKISGETTNFVKIGPHYQAHRLKIHITLYCIQQHEIRGPTEKFRLHLNIKWKGKDNLIKKICLHLLHSKNLITHFNTLPPTLH